MATKQQQTAEQTTEQTEASAPSVASGNSGETRPQLVIGRIVHFVAADGSERAAIVTRVYAGDSDEIAAGLCDLAVFTTAEEHGSQGAVYGYGKAEYDASGKRPNTWHWYPEGTAHPDVRPGGGSAGNAGSGSW